MFGLFTEGNMIPSHAGKVLTAIKSSMLRNRRLHLSKNGPNAVLTVIVNDNGKYGTVGSENNLPTNDI